MDDRVLTARVAKATAAALAVAAAAFGLWEVRSVIILLLLAVTFASAMRPGVEWLGAHRIPQSLAVLLHFLAVGVAVALLIWLAVPPAIHQIGDALHSVQPRHPNGVKERMLVWLQQHLRNLPTGTELVHPVATYGHKAGTAIVAILFTLAATWYCVSESESILKLLIRIAPEAKREKARETYLAIDRRLGAYMRLRFLDGVRSRRSPFGRLLRDRARLLAARGRLRRADRDRPHGRPADRLGARARGRASTIASRRAALAALARLVREFQSYVINPHIGKTVGLSPLVTLVCVSVVGVLFGGLAVVLAVPITSAVATLIDVLVLGHDPPPESPRKSLRTRRTA